MFPLLSQKQVGVLRLWNVENTGSGEQAQVKKGDRPMAENSTSSVQNDKKNTGSGSKLTPGESLEILQQAVLYCRKAGVDIRIAPLYSHGERRLVLVLSGVELVNGQLKLIENTSTGTAE